MAKVGLFVSLKKAFSDSARKAALESRRRKAQQKMGDYSGADHANKDKQPNDPGVGLHIKVNESHDRTALGLNYDPRRITTDRYDATSVSHTAETDPAHKMKVPDTRGIHVRTENRPVDYGHAGDMMKEKYGEQRGQKMYDSMIDGPSARFFQAGTKIVAEKMAMMNDLGKVGKPSNHHYQGLHQKWTALKAAGGKKK